MSPANQAKRNSHLINFDKFKLKQVVQQSSKKQKEEVKDANPLSDYQSQEQPRMSFPPKRLNYSPEQVRENNKKIAMGIIRTMGHTTTRNSKFETSMGQLQAFNIQSLDPLNFSRDQGQRTQGFLEEESRIIVETSSKEVRPNLKSANFLSELKYQRQQELGTEDQKHLRQFLKDCVEGNKLAVEKKK